MPGCPIRTSADQFVCANPRSFSQLTTSFVASESLGIRHTPLTISFLIIILVQYFFDKLTSIDIFINSALESARLSLCDVFTVNVNDLNVFFSN
jgi:hypothetical protein